MDIIDPKRFVKEIKRSGTASRECNGRYFRILKRQGKREGVQVPLNLINSSLLQPSTEYFIQILTPKA